MDLNGKNDAYCSVVNLKTPKKVKKTQILYKTKEPKWNYFINGSCLLHDVEFFYLERVDHPALPCQK